MAGHLGVKTPGDPATRPVSDTGKTLLKQNSNSEQLAARYPKLVERMSRVQSEAARATRSIDCAHFSTNAKTGPQESRKRIDLRIRGPLHEENLPKVPRAGARHASTVEPNQDHQYLTISTHDATTPVSLTCTGVGRGTQGGAKGCQALDSAHQQLSVPTERATGSDPLSDCTTASHPRTTPTARAHHCRHRANDACWDKPGALEEAFDERSARMSLSARAPSHSNWR